MATSVKLPTANQIVNGVVMTAITLAIINRVPPLRRIVNG